MSFDPRQHSRAADGRFIEKVGSAAEVSLGPAHSTRHDEANLLTLPRGGIRKDDRLTASDVSRIRDYLDRHDIVFVENKQTGIAQNGEYGTADQALADLIIAARNHEQDNRFNEDENSAARELFGDEYQSLVNPQRTFWEQMRGF